LARLRALDWAAKEKTSTPCSKDSKLMDEFSIFS